MYRGEIPSMTANTSPTAGYHAVNPRLEIRITSGRLSKRYAATNAKASIIWRTMSSREMSPGLAVSSRAGLAFMGRFDKVLEVTYLKSARARSPVKSGYDSNQWETAV